MKLPLKFKYSLIAVLAISWCTGIAFFILSRWVTVEGDFGPENHPLQFPVLKLHGAGAFLMMIAYGYLLAAHVERNWANKRQRKMGIVLTSLLGFQVISAYLLYYIGGEAFRDYVGIAHFTVGVVFPFILVAHIRASKCSR